MKGTNVFKAVVVDCGDYFKLIHFGKFNLYDEKEIQPILHYNKLKKENRLRVTVGVLGKSKIFRIPKIAEHLYKIYKGEKFDFDLKPGEISIKMKD